MNGKLRKGQKLKDPQGEECTKDKRKQEEKGVRRKGPKDKACELEGADLFIKNCLPSVCL